MLNFTLKDFIEYNNPCFNCDGNSYIEFGRNIKNLYPHGYKLLASPNSQDQTTYVKTSNQTRRALHVQLHITYKHTITLSISKIDNSFKVNDYYQFNKYAKNNSFFLRKRCSCGSIYTKPIDFDYDKCFIKPFVLDAEHFEFSDEQNLYNVFTDYNKKSTIIEVTNIKKEDPWTFRSFNKIPDHTFKLPLFPLSTFKTKEALMNKIKTYIIFS